MSCSLRGCGFGKVQNKSVSNETFKFKKRKSQRRSRKSKSGRRKLRRSRKIRKSRRHRRSRRFGFKYLRNDQIINSVLHNYPSDLTCDRA